MWKRRIFGPLQIAAVSATVLGCTPIPSEREGSPLAPPRMSPDSVVLDIFFARCDFGDPAVNEDLWHEVDEQQIALDARRRLAENGFRAGLIGGQMPVSLSRLLELKDKPAPNSAALSANVSEVADEKAPMWSHKQLRAGKRSEIITSDVYDQLPVLRRDEAGVCGRSYEKAQGVIVVHAEPQPDGRVKLRLVPELQHGEVQQRFTGNSGAWRIDMVRPRCTFDQLEIEAELTPGQMVVLSSLPSRPGSLGHHFLTTDSSGQAEQKVLVVRLSQTQHDQLFEPTAIPLDHVR